MAAPEPRGEFENAFDDKELSNALMLLGIDKKNCKEPCAHGG